jgi:hypothetical protein
MRLNLLGFLISAGMRCRSQADAVVDAREGGCRARAEATARRQYPRICCAACGADFAGVLIAAERAISIDGRGRWMSNAFVNGCDTDTTATAATRSFTCQGRYRSRRQSNEPTGSGPANGDHLPIYLLDAVYTC